jgi:putative sterol carrier protein
MAEKFFSESWLKAAHEAERAVTEESRKLIKDPDTFTHVLAFEVADHPGVNSYLRFEAGRSVAWTATPVPEDDVWARFVGSLDAWRACAEGKASASTQVMGGKIKITKGDMMEAFANAPALDMLARLFGEVDTDWDI